MKSPSLSVFRIVVAIAGMSVCNSHGASIVLRSGNGSIGGLDSEISMLGGPADTFFPLAFSQQDFTDAINGPAASIIGNNGVWISTLPADPSAKWIATNSGGASSGDSALYAIQFEITEALSAASLDFYFAVDNLLGGGLNEGLYLNGTAIPGTSGGTFGSQFSFTGLDVVGLLDVGTNTLFINQSDVGGPGGLIFSATLTTTPVPEPGVGLLAGGVVLALLGLRRRGR